MKVLLINVCCGTGSTGRICTDIADMLINQGHDCKIAYGRDKVPEKYRDIAVKIGSSFEIYRNALKVRLFDNEGFNAKRSTRRFVKWIQEYDPDVIHLHNLHGYYLNIEILFSYLKTCGKKVIWTLHDCWAFTGHCAYCPQRNTYPKSWSDRAKRNHTKKKALFTDISDLTIVTPSQWLADLVKQSFLKDYPVEVIYNGINLDVFKPTESAIREKYGIRADQYILLGVAFGWGKRKGLDVFIELSQRLDKKKYRIVLVGTDEKTDKLLPKEIISIHRTQNQTELAEIYTAADLFVNPTREENYPTVNMEAIACGTPVLTFQTGGSPEILSKKTGLVVPCDDVDAMEYEIIRICETQPFSQEDCIVQAKNFNEKIRYQEYLKLY